MFKYQRVAMPAMPTILSTSCRRFSSPLSLRVGRASACRCCPALPRRSREKKIAVRYRLQLGVITITIYHDSITIYHDSITVYHDSIIIYHYSITIYHYSIFVYHYSSLVIIGMDDVNQTYCYIEEIWKLHYESTGSTSFP